MATTWSEHEVNSPEHEVNMKFRGEHEVNSPCHGHDMK